MDNEALEVLMQRVGGWCAIAGAGLLAAASIGFGGLTFGSEPEAVLQQLAQQPVWYWPAVHLAFAAGAVLWINAFIALNSSFRDIWPRLLGSLGVVSIVLGAALHVIDSFISGAALTALAHEWAAAPVAQRGDIVKATDTLLMVLGGTWTGVVVLFHGVPFLLDGTAVSRSARYPRYLRWAGTMAGFGSMATGALMLTVPSSVHPALYFVFAGVGMAWMVGVGIVLKRAALPARRSQEAPQQAQQVA